MAEKNILMQRKNADGTFDVYYPKTKVVNLVEGGSGILDALKTVDGAGSGLDADLVRGIDVVSMLESGLDADLVRGIDVVSMLERNAYDDYLRTMELYYTGHFGGPAIAGFKGMTFDGFLDTSRVNVTNTDVVIEAVANQSYKIVRAKLDINRPISAAAGGVSVFTNNAGTWSNIGNQVDSDPVSYSLLYYSGKADVNSVLKYDLGAVRSGLREIVFNMRRSISSGSGTFPTSFVQLAYSQDGENWTVIDITDIPIEVTTKEYRIPLPFITARYIAVNIFIEGFSTSYDTTIRIYDVNVVASYLSSTLETTAKQLAIDTAVLKLVVSANLPSGGTFVPSVSVDGITFTEMLAVSSRTDPLNAGFVEYEYQVSMPQPGRTVVLKLTLSSVDGVNSPQIKNYGLFWS